VVLSDVSTRRPFWAHIDIDTLKAASPMWTFPGNLRMQGDSGRILEQLLAELRGKRRRASSRPRRRESIPRLSATPAWRGRGLAADKGGPDEINLHYLFAELERPPCRATSLQRRGAQCRRRADAAKRPLPNTVMRSAAAGRLVRRHGWRRSPIPP
jgi:acetolactate synthase-1/2/3 large subunit